MMWLFALLLVVFTAGCDRDHGVGGAGVAPIDPGILSPFAIASAGGMTNTGATKINGNVVLDPNFFCNPVPSRIYSAAAKANQRVFFEIIVK